jgi:hypothetical protein
MTIKKILILVKTYPLPSTKSGETVCTAGITEDGEWIRIYPIPFRMHEGADFKKYDWIEILVEKRPAEKDSRKESYYCDYRSIKIVSHLNTDNLWQKRKDICFKNDVFYSISKLIESSKRKNNKNFISLAIFKPAKILNLLIEEVDTKEKQERRDNICKSFQEQQVLFEEYKIKETWQMSQELDVKFRYEYTDSEGRSSKLQIEDWEIGALYRKLLKNYSKDEALKKVKEKFLDEFNEKNDVYFFMGTLFKNQMLNSTNPWAIIGVFYPPKKTDLQLSLPGM